MSLAGAAPAAADSCCNGLYVQGVATGGGTFTSGIRSVGPVGGAVNKDRTQDDEAGGGVAIGFDFRRLGAPVRFAVEYQHDIRIDYDRRPIFTNALPNAGFSNNINVTTITANVLYDWRSWGVSSWWRPYAGLGVGFGQVESEVAYKDFNPGGAVITENKVSRSNNLVWSATGGFDFDITENWFAEAAYQFVDKGELKVGPFASGVELKGDQMLTHQLRLAVGYRF
ncbi:MAG: porin family protein [Alphaproteobacteria bacterium]|nr:porin family protein [Alphaproteobacteria bacterium]